MVSHFFLPFQLKIKKNQKQIKGFSVKVAGGRWLWVKVQSDLLCTELFWCPGCHTHLNVYFKYSQIHILLAMWQSVKTKQKY